MTSTHTRTHVGVTFANPYLTCDSCRRWVGWFHDQERCGCDAGNWNIPCEHPVGVTSSCPSWGPVDGCRCQAHLGAVPHGEPGVSP